jgi:serine/threonine protein kinase
LLSLESQFQSDESPDMSKTCEKCGKPLDKSGTCQVCLINLGISQGAEQSELDQKLSALPSIEDLNEHFPQLQITRLVGRGGMGAIYHARQTALERDVALKIIAKEVAGDTAFIERFEREAKTLARLSHPNIVTIFDFGRTIDGQAYLVMEFVDGINLREAMASNSVAREDALGLISTICKALEYAHSKGVVHRDIKPENILLGEDGTVKVADFGIAKIVDNSISTPTLTATRQVLGSLHYLAPEHLESPNQVDHRVDLYALGVIFYELLTGQLPLGRYEPPSAVSGGVDYRLDPVVMKALSRQPSQRYQNASELEGDLQRISGSQVDPQLSSGGSVSGSHHDSSAQQGAFVPFTLETFAGLARSVGFVRATPGELKIEHRLQDAIFGSVKSDTRVTSIPVANITSIDFVPSVFQSKLVIATDSISTMDNLPGAESGRVELKIKRSDSEMALQVVRALGFSPSKPHLVAALAESSAAHAVKLHSGWTTFGVFMIFCGIVNAGLLAIAEVFIAEELDTPEMIAAAVGAAVLFGPVIAIQIVSGLLSLVARPIGFARAASLVSMIPITPAWILSCPIGIWAYRWLKQKPAEPLPSLSPAQVETSDVSQSMFWSTTSLFIPESRWGRRLLAVGNVTAAALAIGAFATFKLGLYPTTMTYRIVDSTVSSDQVLEDVGQRIRSMGSIVSSSRSVFGNEEARRNVSHFEIALTARNSDAIRQVLSIEGNVQIARLANNSDAKSKHKFSVVPGLDLPSETAITETDFRTTAAANESPNVIESKYVSRVSRDRGKLMIDLSRQGQEHLLDSETSKADFVGFGLVVDGHFEAFASPESVSGRKMTFTLSNDSGTTAEAIMAAVRGPVLATDLELLD